MDQHVSEPWLSWLQTQTAQLLDSPGEHVSASVSLSELGLDSVMALRLAAAVSDRLGREFDPVLLFDHPTLDQLARYLQAQANPSST